MFFSSYSTMSPFLKVTCNLGNFPLSLMIKCVFSQASSKSSGTPIAHTFQQQGKSFFEAVPHPEIMAPTVSLPMTSMLFVIRACYFCRQTPPRLSIFNKIQLSAHFFITRSSQRGWSWLSWSITCIPFGEGEILEFYNS